MAHTDGDGWLQCTCGNRHWGLHGAAGLLLVRDGTILLQHRAPWVHNGDTWGIPGGAKDSHETILEGAKREAREELGIDTDLITAIHTYADDHGPWRYDTVICLVTCTLHSPGTGRSYKPCSENCLSKRFKDSFTTAPSLVR
jgi:8-oxo-dGTP diphosphatase